MMPRALKRIYLLGFLLLLLLLLLSALLLFDAHYSFSPSLLYEAYAGSEDRHASSFLGILKVFTPHMLLMPLSFFILFHIGLSLQIWRKKRALTLGMAGFITSFGDIFINFFIALNPIYAYIKILLFLGFELLLLYLIWALFRKALRTN